MNEESLFFRKLKETLDISLESSKKAVKAAMEKSKELEDYGVLKLDIRRLENRSQELLRELGLRVFSEFSDAGKPSVSRKTDLVDDILNELEENRDMRERKENQLNSRNKNNI